MNNRTDAIYARQSIDKKDSISIESQIEFCKYELKGGSYQEYIDKGYSGKNTDRPQFLELSRKIEQGLIKRVVVYKLDRISRSIIDFANMMDMFQKYNVEFVSSTEKFDTSTPMGRAMLNICIVFAQLERETIQKRVTDSYYSRCQKGFHMSGSAPFGYRLEPTVVDGIRTKMLVANPDEADLVRLMYDMYADPNVSLREIIHYFVEHDLSVFGKELQRRTLSLFLRNPVYAQVDMDLYNFFKGQGTAIVNDASDFTGTNGCYFFRGRDAESKDSVLKDQILVIAPHEGIVPSDTWLTCRKKLMKNAAFGTSHKAKNTWLAGKIKCGRCGAGLVYANNKADIPYFRCRTHADKRSCAGCGALRVRDLEKTIFAEMTERMGQFQTLSGKTTNCANPKLTAYRVELAQVESEIEKLLNSLMGANTTLLSYANSKIEELDARRQALMKSISDISADEVSPEKMKIISNYLDNWNEISFEDRRLVVDGLLFQVRGTVDNIQIEWKI